MKRLSSGSIETTYMLLAERVGFVRLARYALRRDFIVSATPSRRSPACIHAQAEADGGLSGTIFRPGWPTVAVVYDSASRAERSNHATFS
jgi:hypothetical protein